jgi:hypothetical protein
MSDQDREVQILIKAKNLTAEEFAKAREQIAGLSKSAADGTQQTKSSFDSLKNHLTSLWNDPLSAVKGFATEFAGTSLKASMASALAFGGILTVVAGVLVKLDELAMKAMDAAAELDDMADITGISVVELSALKYAASAAGVPLDQLKNYIFAVQQRMQENPGQFSEGLTKIGLSIERVRDLQGDQLLLTIARAFRENTDSANRAGVAVELFGKQGREAIPLLMEPLDELTQKAKELGLTLTDDDAKAAEEFKRSLNALKAEADATWNKVGLGVSVAALLSKAWADTDRQTAHLALSIVDLGRKMKAFTEEELQFLGLMKIAAGALPEITSAGVDKDADGGAAARLAKLRAQIAGNALNPMEGDQDWVKAQIKQFDEAFKARAEGRKQDAKDETEANKRASEDYHAAIVKEIADLSLLHQAAIQARVDPIREAEVAFRAGLGVARPKIGGLIEGVPYQALEAQFRTPILAGMKNVFSKDVPASLIAALQGGGNPYAAVGATIGQHVGDNISTRIGESLEKKASSSIASKIGGIVGNVVPIIGPIIGAIGGKLIGAGIGKLHDMLKGGEGAKVNDMRDQFIGAAGGLDALNKKAHDAGTTLDKLLAAKKVKDFESAVNELNGKMGDFANDQAKDQADLETAIQRYGFSIEELGPKMRQQKLDEQAQLLMNDFRLLAGSGIDVGTVIDKMGGSINEFVVNALKTGSEVPASMKPMLEKMIEMGTLTDDSGNKITSLEGSGLKFSESMSQGFEKIAKKFDTLLEGLGLIPKKTEEAVGQVGSFKNALAGVKDLNVSINARWNIEPPPDIDVPGHARGGVFNREHIARIAEGGQPEIVGSVDFMTKAVAAALDRLGSRGVGDASMLDGLVEQVRILRQEMRSQRQMLPNALLRAVRDGGMV